MTASSFAREYTLLCPFGGLGAGALGFVRAETRLFETRARFRLLGGIDIDPEACVDFERLTGVPELCADIWTLTAEDLRTRFGARPPDVVFASPPCKGASGLLSEQKARTAKYRRLNKLALGWFKLMLEAWPDAPPRLVLFENVPRIVTRARRVIAALKAILRRAGYVLHAGFHDAGEIGGLAQHRRRYLLVARHQRSVPSLLYQPTPKRVRACGEILGSLPMPNDPAGGPMHRIPQIGWLNWVRLALIPAGGDWRDLPGASEEDLVGGAAHGATEHPRLVPQRGNANLHWGKYEVRAWEDPVGTVTGADRIGSGAQSVADPRARGWFHHVLRVVAWGEPSGTVTASPAPSSGAGAVADPRIRVAFDHGYRVTPWAEPNPTIAGGSHPGQGAYSVADPRLERATLVGPIPLEDAAPTVFGKTPTPFAVVDPASDGAPIMVVRDINKAPPMAPVIVAADGTWHRPLTTLELAALQGLPVVVDGRPLALAGNRSSAHRERIGNAVPVQAAQAIAEQTLLTLLSSDLGAFALSSGGAVWVSPEAEA